MLINKDQICTVKVYEKLPYDWYEWKEGRKGLFPRREGFYFTRTLGTPIFTPIEDIGNNFIIEGKKVYYRPHVNIQMSNGNTHSKFYNTIEQLHTFMASEDMSHVKIVA